MPVIAAILSGCTGIPRTEADSVAYIVCARYGIPTTHQFPSPPDWAGRDPRAQPAAAILTVGERVTAAATRITRHLDLTLAGQQAVLPAANVERTLARPPPEARVLTNAQEFFASQLSGSWGPRYLHTRGIDDAAIREWGIGYAPAQWTALTDHLRTLGHQDDAIQAAGLASDFSRTRQHGSEPKAGPAQHLKPPSSTAPAPALPSVAGFGSRYRIPGDQFWARRLVPEIGPMTAAARGTGGERWAAASARRSGPVWPGRLAVARSQISRPGRLPSSGPLEPECPISRSPPE